MAQTSTWALPYPASSDPADVPVDMQELAERLDSVLTQLRSIGSIPGELKVWPNSALPELATYGHWAWADGAAYDVATYPIASSHIAAAWKTHGGKPDPGAGKFRVPDMRGETVVGMDAMPGGVRRNRIARAASAVLAAITGEEVHAITIPEMASHGHGVNDPTHVHSGYVYAWMNDGAGAQTVVVNPPHITVSQTQTLGIYAAATGISIAANGGGGAHETMQPSVFVPWIVKLDD